MLKKVNKATKFSTVKTQICGIKLGTPNTALQSCPYYGDRNCMMFETFTWNWQENCPY